MQHRINITTRYISKDINEKARYETKQIVKKILLIIIVERQTSRLLHNFMYYICAENDAESKKLFNDCEKCHKIQALIIATSQESNAKAILKDCCNDVIHTEK